MNGEFEFQFPWVLALLGLLPIYALLRGKIGKLSALTFSSADIARAAGAQARAAAGRFLILLGLLPIYALLRGKIGKLSALTFSSADIARAAGAQARAAAGRFLIFLRLL